MSLKIYPDPVPLVVVALGAPVAALTDARVAFPVALAVQTLNTVALEIIHLYIVLIGGVCIHLDYKYPTRFRM